MSFFGFDGLDHQLKQLKSQLASKDSELMSIRNEQRKRAEELTESKKAREAIQYQLAEEAERARKAETAVQTKTVELSKLRLQHDNLETSLRSASDKVKNGEKETQKLQYELDRAANSDIEGPLRLLQEQKLSLEVKVKAMESALRKTEDEKRTLEDNIRASGKSRSALAAVSSLGGTSSPSRPKGSRRRSASTSELARTSDLETEVENLKIALDVSSGELSKLQAQMASAKKERMKIENEKMVLERSAKKDIEGLNSKLEDAMFELEDWRRSGDGDVKAELEKAKQAAKAELDAITKRLDAEVQEKEKVVQDLGRNTAKLAELDAELDLERTAKAELERQKPAALVDSSSHKQAELLTDIETLTRKIVELEADVENARSVATCSQSGSADKAIRKLQRELDSARRDNRVLEEQVDELHERNHALTTRVPLPESPTLSPRSLPSIDAEHLMGLETQVRALEAELEERQYCQVEELRKSEKRLNQATKELEAARADILHIETAFETFKAESEDTVIQRDAFDADLREARGLLQAKLERIDILNAETKSLNSRLVEQHDAVISLRSESDDTHLRLREANEHLEAKTRQLSETAAFQETLIESLRTRTHDDLEVDELGEALAARTRSLQDMAVRAEEAETAKMQLEVLEFGMRQELDIAREQMERLRLEMVALKVKMTKEVVDAKASLLQICEIKNTLSIQLDDTKVDTASLRLQLEDARNALFRATSLADSLQNEVEGLLASRFKLEDELSRLQETIADRSTESEAIRRDVRVFQLQEDVRTLQHALDTTTEVSAKEIAAISFAGEQNAREAKIRVSELDSCISELQARLASAHQSHQDERPSNIGLLHVKIQQLRTERDDLKRSKSFSDHEHHFALKAAEADRASAVEDLIRAQSESRQKEDAYEELQMETAQQRERLHDVATQLQMVSASFATASSEKNDLADRVAEIELELGHALASRDELVRKVAKASEHESASLEAHRTHNEQLVDLASRLAIEQGERSKAQNELVTSNRARCDLEVRVDQLHTKVAELQKEGPESDQPNQADQQSRMRSGVPSPTMMQTLQADKASLQADKADLQGRLQRRIETINQLEAEKKRDKMNLHMAEESLKEQEDEIALLAMERNTLNGELAAQASLVDSGQAALRQADTEINSQLARVSQLDNKILEVRDEGWAEVRDLVLALAVQKRNICLRTAKWHASAIALKAAESTIAQLLEHKTAREATLAELENLEARVGEVEAARSVANAELVSARENLEATRGEIQHLRSTLDETQAHLSVALRTAEEKASSINRIDELEADISLSRERISHLEADIETLLARVAVAEKARTDALSDAETDVTGLRARVADLEVKEGKVTSLQSELDVLLNDLAENGKLHTQAMNVAEARISHLSDTQDEMIKCCANLEAQLVTRTVEFDKAVALTTQYETDSTGLKKRLAEAIADAEGHQHASNVLCQEVQRSQAMSTAEQESLRARNAETERTLTELAQLIKRASTEQELLRSRLVETETELAASIEHQTVLRQDLLETRDRYERAVSSLATQAGETEALKIAASQHEVALKELQADADNLQEDRKQSVDLLTFKDVETEKISTSLKELKSQLASAQQEANATASVAKAQHIEVSHLVAENAELKATVAGLSAAAAGAAGAAELQERINELEASLTLKVQELDESDDRVRDMYKNSTKLEKKVAKLTRQLAAAETSANTAANRTISVSTAPMDPPPVPVLKAVQPVIAAITPRQPLRPVNVFEPTPQTPSIGSKRNREGDGDEKPPPVECIVLPPSTEKAKKSLVRTAFTPQRGAAHVFGSRENSNIFAHSDSVAKPVTKNAFARSPSANVFQLSPQ